MEFLIVSLVAIAALCAMIVWLTCLSVSIKDQLGDALTEAKALRLANDRAQAEIRALEDKLREVTK